MQGSIWSNHLIHLFWKHRKQRKKHTTFGARSKFGFLPKSCVHNLSSNFCVLGASLSLFFGVRKKQLPKWTTHDKFKQPQLDHQRFSRKKNRTSPSAAQGWTLRHLVLGVVTPIYKPCKPFWGKGNVALVRGLTITMAIKHVYTSWDDPSSRHQPK